MIKWSGVLVHDIKPVKVIVIRDRYNCQNFYSEHPQNLNFEFGLPCKVNLLNC